jgi:hypothetical protein
MAEVTPSTGEPVADRLVLSSIDFAQSAVGAYCGESWEIFYLHLAIAIEQVLKAVLAAQHPSLIADARGFDSLLHLCGLGHHAKTPEFARAVRTITANEALDRVSRFVDDYQQPPARVRLLLEVRNAIAHAGHAERGEAEAVLGDTAEYVEQLLPALCLTGATFWGDSAELVSDHAKRRLNEREASYARRLQAAKERFARLSADMEPAAMEAVVAASEPAGPNDTFDAVPAACPACRHNGDLWGDPEPEWEADWDVSDGQAWSPGAYVSRIELQGAEFKCGVCGLSLGPSLLPFAGLERVSLTPNEYDIADATRYFERAFYDEEDYVS